MRDLHFTILPLYFTRYFMRDENLFHACVSYEMPIEEAG